MITLGVDDLERAVEFYTDMGLTTPGIMGRFAAFWVRFELSVEPGERAQRLVGAIGVQGNLPNTGHETLRGLRASAYPPSPVGQHEVVGV